MELKVLCVGDVVGEPGLERVRKSLRKLKRDTGADLSSSTEKMPAMWA